MSKVYRIGDRRIGLFCGARLWRLSDWRSYGLFRKRPKVNGFNVGPVLVWDGS